MPLPWLVAAAKKSSNPFRPGVIRVKKEAVKNSSWSFTEPQIQAKIKEGTELVKNVTLGVGDEKIPYTEKRIRSGESISVSSQKFSDYEREIALVLLHQKSGKLDVVKIVKRGGQLVSPPGYQINVVERMNGIKWNHWATQYKVVSPKDTIVILNKYPVEANGTIEYFVYSPFSNDLAHPEILKEGARYLNEVVERARKDLRDHQVMSRSVPGKLVIDVLPADFFKHLPFLEQSDLLEALWDSDYAINRVLGTLGSNKDKAWTLSSNYAGANGWVQFTDNWKRGKPGTYSSIARLYPMAKLNPNFKEGAADHVNSMKAAILLYDNNLGLLVKEFGTDIAQNSKLDEFLAAAYNGPPSKVISSLNQSGSTATATRSNWFEGLFAETEGYIAKLRLLKEKQVPQKYLD